MWLIFGIGAAFSGHWIIAFICFAASSIEGAVRGVHDAIDRHDHYKGL